MTSKKDLYDKRPLSPHLTIYRPQISSTLSILHRLTGVIMFICLSAVAWCFVGIFLNSDCAKQLSEFYNEFAIIKLALMGISYAFIYHSCNGVRHLFWDIGYGYEIKSVRLSGWLIIITSIMLTILFWSLIL